jgi:S1-C subfamily serine protease
MEMIQLSGQQGVPVINVDGQVVVGFDQGRLMELLNRARPKLGASVADAASQARTRPGLPSAGAYVGQVRPGSPAERAGLRLGDVITGLGGEAVQGATHLHRLLQDMPKGSPVPMTYVRDGQELQTVVRL